ncbi:MAG: hypothetical protein ORN28_10440 [Rhodoferax sp.]|nr:hypothetical protein [Rhodoferax sp.]
MAHFNSTLGASTSASNPPTNRLPPDAAGSLIFDIALAASVLSGLHAGSGSRCGTSADCTTAHLAHAYSIPPPATIRRTITSTTYRRRMFVTEPLARLFGFDENAVNACRLLGQRLPATLVDADTGPTYAVLYKSRSGNTVTGELSGEWSRFARNVRVGDAIEFGRVHEGRAGEFGARARALKKVR